jgi:uncharacterized protein YjeT (DUF2065 family)
MNNPMWRELGLAFCLMLVLEGIIPFLYPARWCALVAMMATVDDKALRLTGFASMMAGTLLLYIIR